MSTPTNPPAGWYPDPTNRGGQRYWDGSTWTQQTDPNPPPPFAAGASAAVPWWQTWWAVVPALVLRFPVGLVALWRRKGTSVQAKWIISAATALLVAIALVSTHGKATTPTKTPSAIATTPAVQLVSVPVVAGEASIRARETLTAAHLVVGAITRKESASPVGTVLAEIPAAGAEAAPGSAVDLVIAEPLPRVPRVIGESTATAEARLKAAGFNFLVVRHTVSSGTNGIVISQSPTGGSRRSSGTRVRLVVTHVVAPAPAPAPPPPAPAPSCTTTSSGSCIRGGEFCPQADYGTIGIDAYGRQYTCTGDTTHPHWE